MKSNSYDSWNQKKKQLNYKESFKHIRERDIVFVALGVNIGFEQNGKGEQFLRPVLVYKKFSKQVFYGIPLTTQNKIGKFYASFKCKSKQSTALLSQMRLLDVRRVFHFYGRISMKNYKNIQEKLIALLR